MRVLFSVLLAILAIPALAAPSRATLAVLGFARDGSAFAFEQFGWSSGVAYPYSELVILDAKTGLPFGGTAFQSLIAQEQATQESARMMSYTAAQATLASLDISVPGVVIASASGDPGDPGARTLPFDLEGMGKVSVRLDTAVVKSVGCEATGAKVRALAIRLLDGAGGLIRDLHKEKNPPPERFCPVGYGIAEIRAMNRVGKAPLLAMIVGMDRPAVDGVDRRYIGFVFDLAAPPEKEKDSEH
jgi:predicted secreted protein